VEDGHLLSYATIRNSTQNYSKSANRTGEAIIEGNFGDSIIISYVGYNDVGFIVNTEHQKLISLSRTFMFLPEVQVFNCKKTKRFTLKNQFKIPKTGNYYGGVNWTYSDITNPYAFLINDIPSNSQIINLSFWLKKHYQSPDSIISAPIMIMAFAVDSLTQLPSKPLISKPIIYYPERDGKQSINIDSVQLFTPKNGLYIAFQYIIDKKYSWEHPLKTTNGTDTTIISYGGIIEAGLVMRNYKSVIYDLSQRKWIKFAPNLIIKFEMEFKKCMN